MNSKIHSLESLAEVLASLRSQGKRIVLCHGTFDLLHAGHLHHLREAKRQGDVLCVTVTADRFVNKGPGRPVFNEHIRADVLASLELVDFVAINEAPTSENVIPLLQPHVYVKGSEYATFSDDVTGNIAREAKLVERYGGKLHFTSGITFSSSELLNKYFQVFDDDVQAYLGSLKSKYDAESIIERIEALRSLRVAVLGEAIIDIYHYCEPMGQIGKGTALAVKSGEEEWFAGGAIAVANHVAGFVDSVTFLTVLGGQNSQESFVRSKLADNIDPIFAYAPDAPTIVKKRYVSGSEKLFEVYEYTPQPDLSQADKKIIAWLEDNASNYDLLIVPDFGNGSISSRMVEAICQYAPFLAVNTQLNSANRGYHVITRYDRADYICLNEPELRLATHDRHGDLLALARSVLQQLQARAISVTRGKAGVLSLWHGREQRPITIPALASKVVDRIGAGDAFLAVSSLLVAQRAPLEIAAFVGSLAAALDVQIVCNREPVDPVLIKKSIITYLK
ncbi:cytidyltransferase [Candidatus Parcubacteria bacterium]|nr:MAG: cytidyltransferase [Candidatus Parcubacteria bacterium]